MCPLPLSVCLSVTLVSPAQTAGPIEMPFKLWTRVGPWNHVLDGGPEGKGVIIVFFLGGRASIVKYRDTLRSSVQKQLNRSNGPKESWGIKKESMVLRDNCHGNDPLTLNLGYVFIR